MADHTTVWVRKNTLARWEGSKREAQSHAGRDLSWEQFLDIAVGCLDLMVRRPQVKTAVHGFALGEEE